MPLLAWAAPLLSRRLRGAPIDDPSGDYAVRSDWSQSRGKLNYSTFVFFDVNRDGRYTLGDRPMGGIKVRTLRNGRVIADARTNSNGFANFVASTSRRRARIRRPGIYEFAVSVPDGWTATSDNAIQAADFKLLPGSISGLVLDEMMRPVGLAPDRVIRGRLTAEARLSIEAHGENDLVDTTEIAGQSAFRYPVPPSAKAVELLVAGTKWRIEASAYPIDVGLLSPDRGSPVPGRTIETIGFDDVNPRRLRKIPSGYAGLNWFNLNALVHDFSGSQEGYVNGNTSGDHIAYTSGGLPAELWSDAPFDFIGVHLAAAWLRSEGEVGTIESWRGDALVASDTVALSALTPVFYNPMLPDITRIRFTTAHCWQMVLDDLVIAR